MKMRKREAAVANSISRLMRRAVAILLVVAMPVCTLTGCGNNAEADADAVYTLETIDLPEVGELAGTHMLLKQGEDILLYGFVENQMMGGTDFNCARLNSDGEVLSRYSLPIGNRDGYYLYENPPIKFDSEGNCFLLVKTPVGQPLAKDDESLTAVEEYGEFGEYDGEEFGEYDEFGEEYVDEPIEESGEYEDGDAVAAEDEADGDEEVAAGEEIEEPKEAETPQKRIRGPYAWREGTISYDLDTDAYLTGDTLRNDLRSEVPKPHQMSGAKPELIARMSRESYGLKDKREEGLSEEENGAEGDEEVKSGEIETDEYSDEMLDYEGEDYDSDAPTEMFYELIGIDKNGEIINDVNIEDVIGKVEAADDYGDPVVAFTVDDKGEYIVANKTVYTLDKNFSLLEKKGIPHYDDMSSYNLGVYSDKNGVPYLRYNSASTYDSYMGKLNKSDFAVSDGKIVPYEFTYGKIFTGKDYDFMICRGGVLYGYNANDSKSTKVIDFIASNIITDSVASAVQIDEKSYFAIFQSLEDDAYHFGKLTKVDKDKAVPVKTITIATTKKISELEKAVVMFNKANKDYNVAILNYAAMYGSGPGYAYDEYVEPAVIEKLNTDIISGKIPDMIVADRNVPIKTYIGKGLIEDLDPYFEADPELDKSDYNENVMNAFKISGVQYTLVPYYRIKTLIVNKSVGKGRKGWTMEEMNEAFIESGARNFLSYSIRTEILSQLFSMGVDDFVNWETGECDFDNEDFKGLLRFVEQFPDDYSQMEWDSTGNEYISVKTFGYSTADSWSAMGCIRNYIEILEGNFGGEAEIVGFPARSRKGSVLSAPFQLAMSSKSKNKDVCWQFMRYFMTQSFQEKLFADTWNSNFPVMNSEFDRMVQAGMEPLYDEYEMDGRKVKEPAVFYAAGGEISLEPLTKEQADYFVEFVNSVERVDNLDPKIMEIISEEIQDYYNGKASLDDACTRIQSRVQIYIYETL